MTKKFQFPNLRIWKVYLNAKSIKTVKIIYRLKFHSSDL